MPLAQASSRCCCPKAGLVVVQKTWRRRKMVVNDEGDLTQPARAPRQGRVSDLDAGSPSFGRRGNTVDACGHTYS